ncbi:MAG: hypothetical protein MN733_44095 [Nitrososphaera sp.]|nr:hypothetical protein [Nitrososphaera sp.]
MSELNYEIIPASEVPAPIRIRENPVLKLKPGEAMRVKVNTADEQTSLQNRLSAKCRIAAKHTDHRYRTAKNEIDGVLYVSVVCED